jgi:DNA-binding transcriptional ArsR family regulator
METSTALAIPGHELTPPALAERLAAMSHPARLKILRQLSGRSCCCGEVVGGLDLAQSTVSQHLKVLVSAGLVRMRQDRQRSLYELDGDAVTATAEALARFAGSCCAVPSSEGCHPGSGSGVP